MIKQETRQMNHVIAKHYGFGHQLDKLIEEMAELTVAIHHMRSRVGECFYQDFFEELADVTLVIEQITSLLTERERRDIQDIMSRKVDRELDRICLQRKEK